MKIFKEFREFAIKGNMFDMAIGIIIGAAFSKIVTSLVQDIMMPALGYVVGKFDFKTLQLVVQKEMLSPEGDILQPAVIIKYGNFIQVVFDFLIIALTIFMVIKLFNKLRNKAEDTKNETIPTPKDIQLLTEIRDLLKEKS